MKYDSEYYKTNSQDRDRPALLFYQRLVNRYLRSGACLDVGCGAGYLLKRLGNGRRADGVEPSAWAAATARARNPNAIIYSTLSEVPSGIYACAISIHVIEHMDEATFGAACKELHRILPVGARLLIITPDASGWAHDNKGDDWIALTDATHINLKGWKQWQIKFEMAGFKILRVCADGLYDFPYKPRNSAIFDVLLRGWPTLFQFLFGRMLLKAGSGESAIFLLERAG